MRIAIYFLTHLAGLAVATYLLTGIRLDGPTGGVTEWHEKIVPMLAVAAILGIVSAILKPATKFLTWPIIFLTLGLFLLVINTAMLMITAGLSDLAGLGFHVDGFVTAFWGALIITGVTIVIQTISGKE